MVALDTRDGKQVVSGLRSNTSGAVAPSAVAPASGWPPLTAHRAATGAVVAGALALFVWHAGRYFPNVDGRIGADYRYFLPQLVAGDFWFQRNGPLRLPYFTPAFCGGMPLLANPQGVALSLPQLLLAIVEPVRAVFLTLVLAAAVGASGSHLLVVRGFGGSRQAGALAATLFLFNGFLLYRLASGHLTYYAFGVVPMLAMVIVSTHRSVQGGGRRTWRELLTPVVTGGVIIAIITYAGALNYHVPVALTVVCLLSIVQLRRGFDVVPWLVLAGSGLWGMVLSAAKLAPAMVMAGQFERVYIPRFLFHDPVEQLRLLLEGLFMPALLPDSVSLPAGGILGRHELELGLTVVPLALILFAAWRDRRARRHVSRLVAAPYSAVILIALLVLPLVLTFGPWEWGMLLLKIPVINNNTTFVRWWSIYLLPVIVAGSLCLDRLASTPGRRVALLASCATLVVAQSVLPRPTYYTRAENTYDPRPVVAAYRAARAGAGPPVIAGIASNVLPAGSESERYQHVNDGFIRGLSSSPCYEPLFGYRLEMTPPLGLVAGPIELTPGPGDALNLVDPSVYVTRGKRTSWRFPAARLADARRFAAYQPYEWDTPAWQRAAGFMSLFGCVGSLLYFAGITAAAIRRRGVHASMHRR